MSRLMIGISGPTSSGKTSLSKLLKESLGSEGVRVFHQDEYYHPDDSPVHVIMPQYGGYTNWEIPSAFDFEKLKKEMSDSDFRIGIAEGITLFWEPDITSLCDARFFVELDEETCDARRAKRDYYPYPPDPPGYFKGVVWPTYLQYRDERIRPKENFHFMDGRDSLLHNLNRILSILGESFPQNLPPNFE